MAPAYAVAGLMVAVGSLLTVLAWIGWRSRRDDPDNQVQDNETGVEIPERRAVRWNSSMSGQDP